MNFTAYITTQLVYWGNPEGQVTNSDLELAGSVLYHAYMAYCFDICKRTRLYCTYNITGLWWQRKGFYTSASPPAHLLCLQAIDQWFHYYVLCQDFVSRVDNGISDHPFHSQDVTDTDMLSHMDDLHPQKLPWRLWRPPSNIVSAIASSLRRTSSPREYLLVYLPPPI